MRAEPPEFYDELRLSKRLAAIKNAPVELLQVMAWGHGMSIDDFSESGFREWLTASAHEMRLCDV